MLQKSKELFELWNYNSLNYCHWKSNEHLMEGLDGDTDLDVLLSRDDKEKGCLLLKEIGFVQFKSQFGSRYPKIEDWIGFDEESGRLLHLHLHYAIMTGHMGMKEYELPWTEETLETREQDMETGVYIMNRNLELVSLYTRLILKANRSWVRSARHGSYTIDAHFLKEIVFIKKQVDWNKVKTIANHYYGENGDEFVEIARSEELLSEQFLRLYNIVTQKMKCQSRYHGLSLLIRRVYYFIIVNLRIRMRKRLGCLFITRKIISPYSGFSVALLGQDGSGKSTVTIEMEKWLTWKIEARRFYLGSGDHYNSLLKRLIQRGVSMKRNISKQPKQESKKSLNSAKKKKNLISFLSSSLESLYFLMVARRAYLVMKRSEKYRKKGGIPLFDRYPQMQFEGLYDGPKIANYYKKNGLDFFTNRIMAKLEYRYFKKMQRWQPDLIFKLMLSPEESIRRKPLEDYENVRQKHEITKRLEFPNSQVYVVDATQDYNEELIYIKSKIWKMLHQKYVL